MLVRLCRPVAGRRRHLPCVFLTALMAAQAGCSLTGMPPGMADTDAATPQPTDFGDEVEENADGWIEEAGEEARGNRRRTKDPDPWWGKYIISEEHRSIEHNLGIDYD